MAEYVLGPGEDQATVSRQLQEHAGERANEVQWSPRPNVPGGGVFVMPDDMADGLTSDRVSQLDDNNRGARIEAATDGRTAPQADPTEFNDRIARGEAPTAASPAGELAPEGSDTEVNEKGESQPRQSRAAARRAAKASEGNKE
jgi:hypothetical protein